MGFKLKSTFRKMPDSVVPDRSAVKTKYVIATNDLNLAANTFTQKIFNANNAADPGGSLDTVKALGYATWQAFYKYYRVYASKCVAMVSGDGVGDCPINVAIVPSADNTGFTAWTSAIAQPYSKNNHFSAGPMVVTVANYMTTEKIFGLNKKTIETDANFWSNSDITTGPAFKWYWDVVVYNQSEAITMDVELVVTITYYVEFFARRPLELA